MFVYVFLWGHESGDSAAKILSSMDFPQIFRESRELTRIISSRRFV